MKMKDLIEFLLNNEYKEDRFSLPLYSYERVRQFVKPIEGINCSHNEKPPALIIYVREYFTSNDYSVSVDVTIRGEINGTTWYTLESYSNSPENIIASYKEIESNLINCWNNLKRLN